MTGSSQKWLKLKQSRKPHICGIRGVRVNKAAPDYNIALKKSGLNENIKYSPSQPKQRNRKRQIIWFTPPYCVNVKANVGKLFMRLIDKHFPRDHKFYKLFNRNNVKLSYSCMSSI